jgi:uncharacterized MAPEG superfamily protein
MSTRTALPEFAPTIRKRSMLWFARSRRGRPGNPDDAALAVASHGGPRCIGGLALRAADGRACPGDLGHRAPAGRQQPGARFEPRISANLRNQFEWPLFFHVACVLLLQTQASAIALALAWGFVAGRLLHSCVQILTTNIRLRGLVFTINFLAVLGLWVLLVLSRPLIPAA